MVIYLFSLKFNQYRASSSNLKITIVLNFNKNILMKLLELPCFGQTALTSQNVVEMFSILASEIVCNINYIQKYGVFSSMLYKWGLWPPLPFLVILHFTKKKGKSILNFIKIPSLSLKLWKKNWIWIGEVSCVFGWINGLWPWFCIQELFYVPVASLKVCMWKFESPHALYCTVIKINISFAVNI